MRNLLKRLFRQKSAVMLTSSLWNGFDHYLDQNNLGTFKDSLYLYIGVTMIAKRVAGVPVKLYQIKNAKGEVEEVDDHELLDLLFTPNRFQTYREFIELSVTYYLLSGDSFWYIERQGAKPVAL